RGRLRSPGDRMMATGPVRVLEAYEKLRDEQVVVGESASVLLGPDGRPRDARLVKDHVGIIHLWRGCPRAGSRSTPPSAGSSRPHGSRSGSTAVSRRGWTSPASTRACSAP